MKPYAKFFRGALLLGALLSSSGLAKDLAEYNGRKITEEELLRFVNLARGNFSDKDEPFKSLAELRPTQQVGFLRTYLRLLALKELCIARGLDKAPTYKDRAEFYAAYRLPQAMTVGDEMKKRVTEPALLQAYEKAVQGLRARGLAKFRVVLVHTASEAFRVLDLLKQGKRREVAAEFPRCLCCVMSRTYYSPFSTRVLERFFTNFGSEMPPELFDFIFSLPDLGRYAIIRGADSYFVVDVFDRQKTELYPKFEEVEEELRAILRGMEEARLCEELLKKARVKILAK